MIAYEIMKLTWPTVQPLRLGDEPPRPSDYLLLAAKGGNLLAAKGGDLLVVFLRVVRLAPSV
jgi:hypothetical protein